MRMTRRGEVAATRVGDLWIYVGPDRPLDDATWREYLELCAEEVRTNGPYPGIMVWAPRHGPSAHQRRIMTVEYADRLRLDQQKRFALITESVLVRGIMTALSWVAAGTKMNAFAPAEVGRAFDWLGEEIRFDRERADDALRELLDETLRNLRAASNK